MSLLDEVVIAVIVICLICVFVVAINKFLGMIKDVDD